MTPEEFLRALEEHNLQVTPVKDRDLRTKEIVRTWNVGRREYRADSNPTIHFVWGCESPMEAVTRWLSFYGSTPTHGIQVGGVVRNVLQWEQGRREFAKVYKVGKYWAAIGYPTRVLGYFPLCQLQPVDEVVDDRRTEEELAALDDMPLDDSEGERRRR